MFFISIKMDSASAAPSCGSVAIPSSSSKTSPPGTALSRMWMIFCKCAEKVERLSWIFWSSPISAYTSGKNAMEESAPTGRNIPVRAISDINPTVFKVTVLPPVLGPEIMITRTPGSHEISLGITSLEFNINSGFLACCRATLSSGLMRHFLASILRASRALAWIRSSSPRISRFRSNGSFPANISLANWLRIFIFSRSTRSRLSFS